VSVAPPAPPAGAEAIASADRSAPASIGRAAERLALTVVVAVPAAIAGIVFATAAISQRNLFAFIRGSDRLAIRDIQVIEGAVAALALYVIVFVVLAFVTRPRRVRPDPATMDLGDDPVPPAIAGYLVNAWLTPHEAAQGTLLDLGARHILSFAAAQQGHTVVRLQEGSDTPALMPYESRVLEHVRSLASNGSVPGEALATWPGHDPTAWFTAFGNEVAADARRRGLARSRWPAWSRLAFTLSAAAPAILAAMAISLAPRISTRGSHDNGGLALAVGVLGWVVLSAAHLFIRSDRDTPLGRVEAAHWLGVRRQLHADEVFPTLPPAAIAIWNRYLGYGAALGAAGDAVRELPLGAEDPRHAWSSFGGRWRMVTVRYPRYRPGWGRSPWQLFAHGVFLTVVGLAPLLLLLLASRVGEHNASVISAGGGLDAVIPAQFRWVLPLIVLYTIAVVGLALYYFVLAAMDATRRRTIVGRALRVSLVKTSQRSRDSDFFWVAVDDGTRPRVDAWHVPPSKMNGISEGMDVRAVVTPQCAHVESLEAQTAHE